MHGLSFLRRATAVLLFTPCLLGLANANTLSGVVVRGADEYAANQWLDEHRALIGRPINAELKARIARSITDKYRLDGRGAPAVTFSNTFEADGVVLAFVETSFVARLEISGASGKQQQKLKTLIAAAKVPADRFDEWLVDLEQSSGLRLRGSLAPMPGNSNAMVAAIDIQELRWGGSLGVDNRSLAGLDEDIVHAGLHIDDVGVANNGVELQAATAMDTEVFDFVGLSAYQAFGAQRIEVGAARTASQLENEFFNILEEYDRDHVWMNFSTRLMHRTNHTLEFSLGLDGYDLDQRFAGSPVRMDQIRAATAELTYSFRPTESRTHQLTIARRLGLNEFGADSLWGLETLDFSITSFHYRMDQKLGSLGAMRLELHQQTTSDVLPRAEQFGLGGMRSGGGFDPSTILGDEGRSARLEWVRSFQWQPLDIWSEVYVYGDYGETSSNLSYIADDEGTTGGIGWRAQRGGLQGYIELAHVISSPEFLLDTDETRIFFAIQQSF